MQAWIIIKPSLQQDPFIDPPPNEDFTAPIPCPEEELLPYWDTKRDFYPAFESSDKQSISTRAHMVACANAFFATQFRRFGFSILLCGSWARFVYWDRSGAVVSRRFQYTANFAPLAEFLWRLNHGSAGDRGVDVSVVPISLPESQDSTVRELLGIGSSDPLYGYIVPVDTAVQKPKDAEGRPSSTTHHFYVGPRPAQKQCSLIEQRARGFHVWDVTQKRVVFFKETWRFDSPGISTESAVYRELHSRRIPNIPTFEHGGDMSALGTKTITHSFSKAWWCCTPNHKAHLPLVQHRIILRDVERHLSTFKTPTEFLIIIKDALTGDVTVAHEEAYKYLGLLHRNISMENIGVTSEGRGLLMGWECCSLKSHDELLKIQMGNIPFMSGALLGEKTQDKRHVLADDLESFLHVMIYTMARHLPNTMDIEKKNALLHIYDEEYVIDKGGRAIGGSRKRVCLADPQSHLFQKFTLPPEIATLLPQLCDLFPIRYNYWTYFFYELHGDPRFKTPSDLLACHGEMMTLVKRWIPCSEEVPDADEDPYGFWCH
ncbi:hypothetical protein CY34DRAFT_11022 [Suillus luteus UH-Slu-Lm8-n1]|uniref:Fungal-type protein kinase domain-containing protein n=1 Tax=Suillus luteus UH-Slu-Lm8-n1 TaxID=930992 RepID=A0A0D0BMD5_9AGAM|nr:hypothetical protein CY34DRAFT_11022 [Suillus luteus UH-Slu-Lm8-n1]